MTEIKGDLISREWLKDAFDNLCCHNCKICRNFRNEDSFYKCNLIENAPTVERPHGEWVYEPYGYLSTYKCSNCGFYGDKQWIFCPYCGVDMRSKEGDEKKSCLNCGSSECELGNRAKYGFCGNWTMREGESK